MSDQKPRDPNDIVKSGKKLAPKGEPIDVDNVVPITGAKGKKASKKRASKKKPTPDDEAFLAGFSDAFEAGARIAEIPAFEKAPIAPELVIPVGYRMGKRGDLWREAGQKSYHVADRVPLLRRVLVDSVTQDVRLEITWLLRNAWRTAIIDRASIMSARETAKTLGAVGAPVDVESAKHVALWLAALERANEHTLPRALVTIRSGWHELEDGKQVFVLGGVALERGELISPRMVFDDRAVGGITRYVRQGGDEAVQRRVIARLVAESDPAAVMIAAALSAPLLERLGAPSYATHAAGPSTRGKTTALTTAGGVYGCPEIRGAQSWVSTWDATSSGLEERAQGSSDLPLCLDEAGLCAPEVRENAVYKLVAGQGRTRASRSGGLRASASWRTVVLSTGEEELVRSTARAGAQVRILQMRVDGLGELTGAEIAEIGSDARRNYGHVGRQWIAKLLEVDDWEPLRLRYRALEREFRGTLGARSSIEQRQAEVFAVLLLAAELAAEWLGLDGLVEPVRRVASSADSRVEIVPEWKRGLTRIAELLASEPGAFTRLELTTSGQKRSRAPVAGRTAPKLLGFLDESPGIEHTPPPKTVLFIIPDPMRARLHEAGLSLDVCSREWKRLGILIPDEDGRLTRRLRVDGTRHRFFALDLDALESAIGAKGEEAPRGDEEPPKLPGQQELPRWEDDDRSEFQDP